MILEPISFALSATFENLENEGLWRWVTSPFTDLLGSMFYLILLLLAVGMVYLKTQNAIPSAFVLVIGSALLRTLIPASDQVQFLLFVFVVLGLSVIIFRIFKKRAGD